MFEVVEIWQEQQQSLLSSFNAPKLSGLLSLSLPCKRSASLSLPYAHTHTEKSDAGGSLLG